jgi:hypothetical protein
LKNFPKQITRQQLETFEMTDAISKTPKGVEEIAKRTFGLNLKMRQLLILIDGKRGLAELEKMVPSLDVRACIAELSQDGFVQHDRTSAQQNVASSVANSVSAEVAALATTAAIGVAVNAKNPQEVVRRTASLITDTLGPNGNDFALRIERCQSLDELRELVPQMFAVVEGVRGSRALADFTRRLGVI